MACYIKMLSYKGDFILMKQISGGELKQGNGGSFRIQYENLVNEAFFLEVQIF